MNAKEELEKVLQELSKASRDGLYRSEAIRLVAATALYFLREEDDQALYGVITETIRINK